MIALLCASLVTTIGRWTRPRATLPSALAAAALFAILSPAGVVWLARTGSRGGRLPRLPRAAVVRQGGDRTGRIRRRPVDTVDRDRPIVHQRGERRRDHDEHRGGEPRTSAGQASGVRHLAGERLPRSARRPGGRVRSHRRPARGNRRGPCARLAAESSGRCRCTSRPASAGSSSSSGSSDVGLSSPWLNAKAMAEASPALVAAGAAGAAAIFETGRRVEAALIGVAIAVGVLWSNGLAYSNAWLAPRARLAELETIGNRFAGQGPTLMTETEPYGVRHFLRNLDPEGAAERRRRLIPLLDGQGLAKGTYADLDQFQLGRDPRLQDARPRPLAEREPSAVGLPASCGAVATTTSGSGPTAHRGSSPTRRSATPCSRAACRRAKKCMRLATLAGPSGRLAAPPRTPAVVVDFAGRAAAARVGERRRRPRVPEEGRRGDRGRTSPSRAPAATASGSAARSGAGFASTSTAGSSPTLATG